MLSFTLYLQSVCGGNQGTNKMFHKRQLAKLMDEMLVQDKIFFKKLLCCM